jgi:hypothetical protein
VNPPLPPVEPPPPPTQPEIPDLVTFELDPIILGGALPPTDPSRHRRHGSSGTGLTIGGSPGEFGGSSDNGDENPNNNLPSCS